MSSTGKWLLVLAVSIEAIWITLITWAERGHAVVGSIFLLLLMGALFLVALYLVLNTQSRPGIQLIISASVLFRVTAFVCPAPFSDDIYRYRYEGRVQAAGGNPYEIAPGDAPWAHLRDETFSAIPAPHARAGYGPVLELIYRVWYRLNPATGVWWWKLPGALFDLAVLGLAARMWGIRAIAYGWSPLPVWEFWGNGHNDSVAVFFVLGAIALRERPALSYPALALATAAKLWPALLFPVFLWRIRSAWVLSAVPLWLALWIPYRTDLSVNVRFTSGFLGGWRNNDSLFGLIAYAAPDPEQAKLIALGIAAVWACAVALSRASLEKAVVLVIAGLLLVSANCHPWYLTWFAPLLGVYPWTPLLLWTALMPVSYSVLIDYQALGRWDGSTPVRWWIYAPVFAVMLVPWRRLSGAERRSRAPNPQAASSSS